MDWNVSRVHACPGLGVADMEKRFRSSLIAAVVIAALAATACSRGPRTAAEFVKSGTELAAKKEYSKAILQFKNAAQLEPKNPDPYYEMGLLMLATYDAKQALAYLNKAA